jgi:hypothetical protein
MCIVREWFDLGIPADFKSFSKLLGKAGNKLIHHSQSKLKSKLK